MLATQLGKLFNVDTGHKDFGSLGVGKEYLDRLAEAGQDTTFAANDIMGAFKTIHDGNPETARTEGFEYADGTATWLEDDDEE